MQKIRLISVWLAFTFEFDHHFKSGILLYATKMKFKLPVKLSFMSYDKNVAIHAIYVNNVASANITAAMLLKKFQEEKY